MYNIINFVISFGAVQGLIVGVLLLIKGFRLKEGIFYLALILLGFAGILGRAVLIGIHESQSSFSIHLNFVLLLSPAFYFYAKESQRSAENPLKFNYQHFLPFLFVNVGYIVLYFSLKNSIHYGAYLNKVVGINDGLSILYFSIYLYLTYKIIRQNRSSYTTGVHQLLNQLLFTFFSFFVIWFGYIWAEWIYFHYTMELMFYYPMMVLLAVILYYLSLQVVFKKQILFDLNRITTRKTFILEDIESKKLLNSLTLLMKEEKPFLDSDISLITLADTLGVNPKTLSFVINEHIHKNFNHYINDWRIEEVKKRLDDKAYDHAKMLSIAFDCGFNSKSTFNLAFKKATGLSPSEYRKR